MIKLTATTNHSATKTLWSSPGPSFQAILRDVHFFFLRFLSPPLTQFSDSIVSSLPGTVNCESFYEFVKGKGTKLERRGNLTNEKFGHRDVYVSTLSKYRYNETKIFVKVREFRSACNSAGNVEILIAVCPDINLKSIATSRLNGSNYVVKRIAKRREKTENRIKACRWFIILIPSEPAG